MLLYRFTIGTVIVVEIFGSFYINSILCLVHDYIFLMYRKVLLIHLNTYSSTDWVLFLSNKIYIDMYLNQKVVNGKTLLLCVRNLGICTFLSWLLTRIVSFVVYNVVDVECV